MAPLGSSGWRRWLGYSLGFDTRSLALLRIGLAAIYLLDMLQSLPYLDLLYSDEGFFPRSLLPGLERVQIHAGKVRLEMLTRIVDERPGVAILYQLLPEGTDPALVEGDDDYVGFVLTDLENGTRLDLTRETSPRSWLSRLTVPIGLRSGGRRYKRKAEAMLREALESQREPGAG